MDKAYIVANKEQELEFLKKFEEKGLVWRSENKPTKWLPSEKAFGFYNLDFPYALASRGDEYIIWFPIEKLEDEMVVYDGRKEDKEVDTRYKVTQRFMDKLIKWRDMQFLDATTGSPFNFLTIDDLGNLNDNVKLWWYNTDNPIERNKRLIVIIQWLNGEDVFEVEKPHKFVVRSEHADRDRDYHYVTVFKNIALVTVFNRATKFDTREEAQEWANSHQVVVEIDEEGNEVE